uniref:hypothetical protein n=1 Tax=Roseateles sp. TaxID=1971397 RepID=UPI003BA4F310
TFLRSLERIPDAVAGVVYTTLRINEEHLQARLSGAPLHLTAIRMGPCDKQTARFRMEVHGRNDFIEPAYVLLLQPGAQEIQTPSA